MVAYQIPPTVAAGNVLTSATWNTYVRDNLDAIAKPPIIWAYQTSVQSIANTTFTQVRWDATNALRGFSLISNVMRATLESGIYYVVANIAFATNATGIRLVQIRSGGAASHETRQVTNTGGDITLVTCTGFIPMTISTTALDIYVYQSSGGALNTGGSAFTEVMVWPASR